MLGCRAGVYSGFKDLASWKESKTVIKHVEIDIDNLVAGNNSRQLR
jgi:hypothetical protein